MCRVLIREGVHQLFMVAGPFRRVLKDHSIHLAQLYERTAQNRTIWSSQLHYGLALRVLYTGLKEHLSSECSGQSHSSCEAHSSKKCIFQVYIYIYIWPWNMVPNINREIQAKGVWNQKVSNWAQKTSSEGFNEAVHRMYRSTTTVRMIIFRRLRWARQVIRMEEGTSVFKLLTGKRTGTRHLGSPRRRWEDNIKIDPKEICVNTRKWVDSTPDKGYWKVLVIAAMKLWFS